jgi:hypothetical protein
VRRQAWLRQRTPSPARAYCLAAVVLLALLSPLDGRGEVAGEYEVKGALISNFAKFIEWPNDSFAGPDSPLVICVEGDGPLESGLAATINRAHAGGRSLRAQRFQGSSRCHILFVGASEQKQLGAIVASVDDRTVTVGEQLQFLHSGGAIEFRVEDNRLKFDVNLGVIARAQYRISSKLLALARPVDGTGPRQ